MPRSDQAAVSAAHHAPRVGGDRAYRAPKVLGWQPCDHTREYDCRERQHMSK